VWASIPVNGAKHSMFTQGSVDFVKNFLKNSIDNNKKNDDEADKHDLFTIFKNPVEE